MIRKINKIAVAAIGISMFATSCSKDFLETMPTDKVSGSQVFESVDGGQAVMDGTYRYMYDTYSTHDDFGYKAIDLASDLMGEDIVCGNNHWFTFDYLLDNNQPQYRRPAFVWGFNYKIIYQTNSTIQGLEALEESDERNFVLGQAYAARANAYTNLIYQYNKTYKGHEGDTAIPLVLVPSSEAQAPVSVKEVYDQIVVDLDLAIKYLDNNPASRGDVSRININVANGFRARVALIMKEWADASKYAEAAMNGLRVSSKEEFAKGFGKVGDYSSSWLWAFTINQEQGTIYASYFSHVDMSISGYAGLGYNPKFVSRELYNQMKKDDIRKDLIVDEKDRVGGVEGYALVNYKYNTAAGDGFSSDYVMMRAAEMLLIQAEAEARLGNDAVAQDLLLDLWTNRQLNPVKSTKTGEELVKEILLERRIELWAEGFRLFDLKRTKSGYDRAGGNHEFVTGANFKTESEDDRFDRVVPQRETDVNQNFR